MSVFPSFLNATSKAVAPVRPVGLVQERKQEHVAPVYFGGARLIDWGNTSRSGMTVEVALRDMGPREVNPFNGLKWGKTEGQRFRTWFGPYSEVLEIGDLPVESLYSGEAQLMFYGDTCTKGKTVKFLLDAGPDGTKGVHPFMDMETGNVEGRDLCVAFWAIDDDESLIARKNIKRKTPFHQLSEVKQSNLVVRDDEFIRFLKARLQRLIRGAEPEIDPAEEPQKWAAEIVRIYLGVESRSVMNEENANGVAARKKWKTLMAEYFQSDEYHERLGYLRR